jgi:hypothetical protein
MTFVGGRGLRQPGGGARVIASGERENLQPLPLKDAPVDGTADRSYAVPSLRPRRRSMRPPLKRGIAPSVEWMALPAS